MRSCLNFIDIDGTVVIGEGDKDEAPLLYIGEQLGTKKGPKIDIAVDPLEGTELVAKGRGNAITVLAAGPKGSLLHAPCTYMDQIAVGAAAKGAIDITAPLKKNIRDIAAALNKSINDIAVAILERDRHRQLIKELRALGCRLLLLEHGTVAAGLAAATPENEIDVMLGIGGAPEAVITAAGVKCLGGDFQGILKPHEEKYAQQARAMGIRDLNHIFTIGELAKGDELQFVATGVSSGPFLQGVIFREKAAITHSAVMRRKSGTVRYITAAHRC